MAHRECHASFLALLQLILVQKVLHTLLLALRWSCPAGTECPWDPTLLQNPATRPLKALNKILWYSWRWR
jgi:hypothetical protein